MSVSYILPVFVFSYRNVGFLCWRKLLPWLWERSSSTWGVRHSPLCPLFFLFSDSRYRYCIQNERKKESQHTHVVSIWQTISNKLRKLLSVAMALELYYIYIYIYYTYTIHSSNTFVSACIGICDWHSLLFHKNYVFPAGRRASFAWITKEQFIKVLVENW